MQWRPRVDASLIALRYISSEGKKKKLQRHVNAALRFKATMKECCVSGWKWRGRSQTLGGQRGRGRGAGNAGRGARRSCPRRSNLPTAAVTFHSPPRWVFDAALCVARCGDSVGVVVFAQTWLCMDTMLCSLLVCLSNSSLLADDWFTVQLNKLTEYVLTTI